MARGFVTRLRKRSLTGIVRRENGTLGGLKNIVIVFIDGRAQLRFIRARIENVCVCVYVCG